MIKLIKHIMCKEEIENMMKALEINSDELIMYLLVEDENIHESNWETYSNIDESELETAIKNIR